jgi:fibronectin-binding autotransporter adhesin
MATFANCVTTPGDVIVCDGSTPNPYTTTLGLGSSAVSGTTLYVQSGAILDPGQAIAIQLGGAAVITLNDGAIVRNNVVVDGGSGPIPISLNTVNLQTDTALTVDKGALIEAAGPARTNGAVSVIANGGTTITNNGTIRALHGGVSGGVISFVSGSVGPANTVVNGDTGLIDGGSGNAIISYSGSQPIVLTNRGAINGNIRLSTTSDQITLYTQGTVSGFINGGGGINTLTLAGAGAGVNGSAISNITQLNKTEAGNWTLNGVLSDAATVNVNAGTLTLTGANTYTGGTKLNAATLSVGGSNALGTGVLTVGTNASGSILANASDGASLSNPIVLDRALSLEVLPNTSLALNGVVSGSDGLSIGGPGTLVLGGKNTFSGNVSAHGGVTIVANTNASLSAGLVDISGSSKLVSGGASNIGNNLNISTVIDTTRLTVGGVNDFVLSGKIDGSVSTVDGGGIVKADTNTVTLTGNNSYKGNTTVSAGSLYVNGDQTGAPGVTTVASGATLGGDGTIGGKVIVADGGTLAPGRNDTVSGTLTVKGDLGLSAGSILNYQFGQANIAGGPLNSRTVVRGNLTLDGTINVAVSAGGVFGPGVYRVFDYTGTLTDNRLALGSLPWLNSSIQTSVANQVNLVNDAVTFWDGASVPKNNGVVDGGDGVWQASDQNNNINWADPTGRINGGYETASFPVFQATPGTVTVDDSIGMVKVSGMQFAADGYLLQGDALTLVGAVDDPRTTIVRVGNGTAGGAGYVAMVNNVLSGTSTLTKTDLGTLILGGDNTYTGGTAVNGGTLQVAADTNLGAASGPLSMDAGMLVTTADLATLRAVTLNGGGGTFAPASGTTLTLNAPLMGVGGLTQAGPGAVLLNALNNYTGGTAINAGTLLVGGPSHPDATIGQSDVATNAPAPQGVSRVLNPQATILAAALVTPGTVTVAAGAALGGYGHVAGPVANAGSLAVGNAAPAFTGGPTGIFHISGTLTNSATVELGGSSVGNTLSVGNYVGQNGRINLSTQLGADNAPSDRLVIDGGNASGSTTVSVINAGGAGAVTPGNGIALVNAINGATTTAGAFTLGNRVVAGPYEYHLFRGSRDGAGQDWYLRTEAPDTTTPPGGTTTPPGGTTTPPGGTTTPPGGTTTPGGVDTGSGDQGPLIGGSGNGPLPEIRREISVYTALSPMLANFGRATLGTAHERQGDAAAGNMGNDKEHDRQVWARVIGQNGHFEAKAGGIYHDGPTYDVNFVAVQAGAQLLQETQDAGAHDEAGLYATAGHGHGDVKDAAGAGAGDNRFDGYSLGGYWTHTTAAGLYIDAVMQGTRYENIRSGSRSLGQVTTDGFGMLASLEAGMPFALTRDWTLEAQSQVLYQGISLDDARDSAAKLRFGNVDSLAGRVGARVSRRFPLADQRALDLWFRVNLWREFTADPKTFVSSANGEVPFHANQKGSWAELQAGVDAPVSKNVSLYGNLGYSKGFDRGVRSVNGTVGVRVAW